MSRSLRPPPRKDKTAIPPHLVSPLLYGRETPLRHASLAPDPVTSIRRRRGSEMGDVTYLLPTQPTLPFSPVPLASSRPPSLGKRRRRSTVGCAALFLRSIHLRRNIESQEFIHAAVASQSPPWTYSCAGFMSSSRIPLLHTMTRSETAPADLAPAMKKTLVTLL